MSKFQKWCEEYANKRMQEEYGDEEPMDDDAYDAYLYEAGLNYPIEEEDPEEKLESKKSSLKRIIKQMEDLKKELKTIPKENTNDIENISLKLDDLFDSKLEIENEIADLEDEIKKEKKE